MAKRFRLRISRVIPSFQSCLSKETSALPADPVPSFYRLYPVNATSTNPPPPPPPPSSKNHYSSLKRHVSACVSSVGCGTRSKPTHSDDDFNEGPDDQFHWQREDKWHVVAKVHHETPQEETETLVSSSRSYSTDSSSEFNGGPHLETIHEFASFDCPRRNTNTNKKKKKKEKMKKEKRCVAKKSGWSPAGLSEFRKLMPCTLEGKVRESFAVVKRSEDPYEDFKRSMMEMILEKRMFDVEDLEQLLDCFLSLNSRQHHRIIVEAFCEIWDTLFYSPPSGHRVSRAL